MLRYWFFCSTFHLLIASAQYLRENFNIFASFDATLFTIYTKSRSNLSGFSFFKRIYGAWWCECSMNWKKRWCHAVNAIWNSTILIDMNSILNSNDPLNNCELLASYSMQWHAKPFNCRFHLGQINTKLLRAIKKGKKPCIREKKKLIKCNSLKFFFLLL